jgi:hypothetical protein
MQLMLWCSAAVLGLLTLYAWRAARRLKSVGDPQGLRSAYLLAAAMGAVGAICTFLAALI